MRNNRAVVFGINEKVHTSERILSELGKRNIAYTFIKWNSLVFAGKDLFSNNKKIDLGIFDLAFFDIPSFETVVKSNRKKRFHFRLTEEFWDILLAMRDTKIRFANKSFYLQNPFYSKFSQSRIFEKNKIISIPTAHLSDNKIENVISATQKLGLGFPIVIKQSIGGMGKNVWKANSEADLAKILSQKRDCSLVFQKFISNDGDFRVLVVGGKSIGIMKRTAKKGAWKNNFALGGKIERYRDKKMDLFAENVAKKMGLDFCGIDIFKSKKRYFVIEVNLFACFEGFEKVYPETNVAKELITFTLNKKNGTKE